MAEANPETMTLQDYLRWLEGEGLNPQGRGRWGQLVGLPLSQLVQWILFGYGPTQTELNWILAAGGNPKPAALRGFADAVLQQAIRGRVGFTPPWARQQQQQLPPAYENYQRILQFFRQRQAERQRREQRLPAPPPPTTAPAPSAAGPGRGTFTSRSVGGLRPFIPPQQRASLLPGFLNSLGILGGAGGRA